MACGTCGSGTKDLYSEKGGTMDANDMRTAAAEAAKANAEAVMAFAKFVQNAAADQKLTKNQFRMALQKSLQGLDDQPMQRVE